MGEAIAFYVIAACILGFALLVISTKETVHSVLFLVLDFLFVAALYVLLGAEFLAAIQILVYAGGIVVLYLFVVMLVNLKRPPEAHADPHRKTTLGFGLAAAVLLDAPFLGVIQVLVYAGGIVVLYLFVVMLVNLKRPPEAHHDPRRRTKLGFGLAVAVLVELGAIAAYGSARPATAIARGPGMPVTGNTEQVGWLLYTNYLIPFEIASMLLLVAMIGAIILAKREL